MAAQLTATMGWRLRCDWAWMVWATSSLPVPWPPRMSTQASVGATRSICARSCCMSGLSPMSRTRSGPLARKSRFSRSSRETSSPLRMASTVLS